MPTGLSLTGAGGAFISLPTVTGGTLTSDATYYYREFTGNGTLTVSGGSVTADLLIVAGGGGGGRCLYEDFEGKQGGGGGGGGAVRPTGVTLSANSYSIVIGAGGASMPITGGLSGNSTTAFGYTAVGGGRGAGHELSQENGGSGGGSDNYWRGSPGLGTAGQGNDGGHRAAFDYSGGHGGGGASTNGEVAPGYNANGTLTLRGGNGGAGLVVFGRSVAGGGGGSAWIDEIGGTGVAVSSGGTGTHGGGQGQPNTNNGTLILYYPAANGAVNTGGGGGGCVSTDNGNTYGSNGGSGIVVVRYTRAQVGG